MHITQTNPNNNAGTVARILQRANNNPDIEALWLYGSQANGAASPHSDYDFAVAYKEYLADPLQRRLRPELLTQEWQEQLALPEGLISVVDISLAPIPLAINIIEADRPLMIKNDLRYARELNRIWGLWADSLWDNKPP